MFNLKYNKHYSGDEPQCIPFPQEILVQLIGLLEKACDRRNTRLVCKGFAKAGLPSLTYTVNLSIAGLDRTQAIAEHPIVSKYITTLVCTGTQLLNDALNYDVFRNVYGPTRRQTELSVPLSVAYERFVSRDKTEKKINYCQRDQAIFLFALQRFVNLQRITFTDVPLVEEDQDLARPQWPGAVSDRDLWDPASPYHLLAVGIRSLYTQGTNLQHLKIVGSTHGIRDRIFSDASETYYSQICGVFGKLHHFELLVNVPEVTSEDEEQPLTYGRLGGLLDRATFLQTLKLASSYWHEPPDADDCPPMLDTATVLQGYTWSSLKCLGLRGFLLIGTEDLMGFFDRHRATLQSVELMAVRILHHPDPQDTTCEAWKQLFHGLRSHGIVFQTLRLFILQDCHDLQGHFSEPGDPTYHGEKMLKYLRQGGKNPLESILPVPDAVA